MSNKWLKDDMWKNAAELYEYSLLSELQWSFNKILKSSDKLFIEQTEEEEVAVLKKEHEELMNKISTEELVFNELEEKLNDIIKKEYVEQKDVLTEQIRGAVARGWCSPKNSNKVMDADLAEAITQEVIKLIKDKNYE